MQQEEEDRKRDAKETKAVAKPWEKMSLRDHILTKQKASPEEPPILKQEGLR